MLVCLPPSSFILDFNFSVPLFNILNVKLDCKLVVSACINHEDDVVFQSSAGARSQKLHQEERRCDDKG